MQWRALAPVLQLHMQREAKGGEESVAAKKDAKGGAADAGARASQQSLLRIAQLVLVDTAPAGPAEAEESRRRKRCEQLVQAMRPARPTASATVLTDWAAYVELLRGASALATSESDATEDDVQCVLLHLMVAAAQQQGGDGGGADTRPADDDEDGEADGGERADAPRRKRAKRGVSKKEAAANEEAASRLSVQLSKSLGALLERFGAHPEQLRSVLALVEQLQLTSAQATLKGRFDDDVLKGVLRALEGVCVKQTDEASLQGCARAWRALLAQEGAPTLHNKVKIAYKRMCDELQRALKPLVLKSKSPRKSLSAADFGEMGVLMRRLSVIGKEEPQSLDMFNGLAPLLLQQLLDGANADASLATTLEALLALQFHQVCLSAAQLHQGVSVGEKGQAGREAELRRATEELLQSLRRAMTVGSLALRLASIKQVCTLLTIKSADSTGTPTALALVDASVLREASDDVIAEVAKLLQALAGGGADGDSAFEDAVAADTHALVHVAVVAAVKCGLHGGLRLGKLLATVLPFWDEPLVALPATLKRVYAKFAKDRTPEEHAAVEFDALTEAFARCDDYEEDVLEPLTEVAQRLADLHGLHKAHADRVVPILLQKGLAWAFDADGDGQARGRCLDAGLVHLLKYLSAATAATVQEKLASCAATMSAVECTTFRDELRSLIAEKKRGKLGTPQRAKGSATAVADGDDGLWQPRFSAGASRKRKSPAPEEEGEQESEQDDELEQEDEDEEEPWDGEGVDIEQDGMGGGSGGEDDDDDDDDGGGGGGDDDDDEDDESSLMMDQLPAYAHAKGPRRRA